jgi:hypothetical protein
MCPSSSLGHIGIAETPTELQNLTTLDFYSTKYTRQLEKINTEQLYFQGNIFPVLRAQIPTYNRSENYFITTGLLQP